MSRLLSGLAVFLALSSLYTTPARAQMGGSRAGIEAVDQAALDLPPLDPKVATSYITLDGRAETRVRPTEIRIVLAVTAEGDTAQKCQKSVAATIDALKSAWTKLKIAPENVVVDFIAVLPVYNWNIEKHDKVEVGVEKKTSYRMQSNVHLAVPNGSLAEAALAEAFALDITDIIGFDYGSRDLDEIKVKVRKEAIDAARAKADALLVPLLGEKPSVINLQEKTTVRYPESMYSSFRASEEAVIEDLRRTIPHIHAYRPRNTYYRGLFSDGDIQPRELPMNPEISVVSTVRLYFKSPALGLMKDETPTVKGR